LLLLLKLVLLELIMYLLMLLLQMLLMLLMMVILMLWHLKVKMLLVLRLLTVLRYVVLSFMAREVLVHKAKDAPMLQRAQQKALVVQNGQSVNAVVAKYEACIVQGRFSIDKAKAGMHIWALTDGAP
jgi:ABC-type multidrug transport system fused ATPase/permease subunit